MPVSSVPEATKEDPEMSETITGYGGPGVLTAAEVAGNAASFPGACGYCSGPHSAVFHSGPCPRVKAIEYHPCGSVKRVEFHDEVPRA